MVRSAARMKIYSVLPMEVTTQQLVAAIAATVAGFAVTLPRSPAGPADAMRGYGRPDRERGGGFAIDGARPQKQATGCAAQHFRAYREVSRQLRSGQTGRANANRSGDNWRDAWPGCNLRGSKWNTNLYSRAMPAWSPAGWTTRDLLDNYSRAVTQAVERVSGSLVKIDVQSARRANRPGHGGVGLRFRLYSRWLDPDQ